MSSKRTPEAILKEIADIGSMERGKLSEIRRKNGKTYHNLQFWFDGKNRCEYVPAKDVEVVRRAVANRSLFRELVDEYETVMEQRTRQARGKSTDEKKKSSGDR